MHPDQARARAEARIQRANKRLNRNEPTIGQLVGQPVYEEVDNEEEGEDCSACAGTGRCSECKDSEPGYKDNSHITGAYSSTCLACTRRGNDKKGECLICKGKGIEPPTYYNSRD